MSVRWVSSLRVPPPDSPTSRTPPLCCVLTPSVGLDALQERTDPSSEAGSVPRLTNLVAWWTSSYHDVLFGTENSIPSSRSSVDDYLPEDAADAAVFIQSLGQCITALKRASATADANGTSSTARTLLEMEAVAEFLVVHRIQYYLLYATPSTKNGLTAATDDGTTGSTPLPPVVAPHGDLGSAALRRGRIKDLVRPYDPTEKLRIMVLMDTILSALDAVRMSHHSHRTLYVLARCVLSGVEQLESGTVADLATCLARCAQSYSVMLQLAPYRGDPSCSDHHSETHSQHISEWGSVRNAVSQYLRPSTVARSPAEEAEERDAGRYLGGLPSSVIPTAVLSDMQILCREVRVRMEDAMSRNPKRRQLIDAHGSSSYAPSGWTGAPEGTAKAVKEADAEAGRLGLMSLQDRKKHTKSTTHTPQRRTIRVRQKEAELGDSKEPETLDDEPEGTRGSITLTEVADICTAASSVRYTDTDFWRVASEFTVWSTFMHCGEEKRRGAMLPEHGTHISEQEKSFLGAVRDVCFALDYVGEVQLYADVMGNLVSYGLLAEPIAAPSLVPKAMGAV